MDEHSDWECGRGNKRRHPCQPRKNQALGIQRAAGEDSISQLRNPLPFGATNFKSSNVQSLFSSKFLSSWTTGWTRLGRHLKTTTTQLWNIDTIPEKRNWEFQLYYRISVFPCTLLPYSLRSPFILWKYDLIGSLCRCNCQMKLLNIRLHLAPITIYISNQFVFSFFFLVDYLVFKMSAKCQKSSHIS